MIRSNTENIRRPVVYSEAHNIVTHKAGQIEIFSQMFFHYTPNPIITVTP